MKKVWNIIKILFTWLMVLLAVGMTIFTVFSLKNVNARDRNIFGYKALIVQSNSMSATDFSAGDLIFVKEVDPSTLQPGDIISFISQNSHNFGETVTHKIRSLTTDENGSPGFVTYGTTTDTDDEAIVTYAVVLGKYVGKISGIGYFFTFVKTPKGYFSVILIPFLLMIGYSLFNCIRLFRQYHRQEADEYQSALEEERQKNEQLRRELEELRDMIKANAAAVPQNPEEKTGEMISEASPKAAQPLQKAEEAPVKITATPKAASGQKEKPLAKQPVSANTADKQRNFAPPKKPGRFAAGPDQKNAGVLPERKPTTQPKRPEGYDELALENILAEYRPRRNKSL